MFEKREGARETRGEKGRERERENNVDSGIKVVWCKGVREKEGGERGGMYDTTVMQGWVRRQLTLLVGGKGGGGEKSAETG